MLHYSADFSCSKLCALFLNSYTTADIGDDNGRPIGGSPDERGNGGYGKGEFGCVGALSIGGPGYATIECMSGVGQGIDSGVVLV